MSNIKQTKNAIPVIKLLGLAVGIIIFLSSNQLKGQPGSAFDFDSDNDYVVIDQSSSNNFDITQKLTISAWVRIDNNSNLSNTGIVAKWNGSANQTAYILWINTNGNPDFRIEQSSSGNSASASQSHDDGQWHHLAGVYDGSNVILYVDGQEIDRNSVSGSIDSHSNQDVRIGNYTSNHEFEGRVDEVRIWDEARTQTEIQDFMHQEIPSPSSKTNLKGYYKFDNSGNSTVTDHSGNNENGSVKNLNNDWVSSNAVINDEVSLGDGQTYNSDMKAVWSVQTSVSSSGLTIKERGTSPFTSSDNMIFAHNGQSGLNNTNKIYNNDTVESRLNREWFIDANSSNNVDLTFKTDNAGSGGFSGASVSKSDYVLINTSNSSIAQNGAYTKNNTTNEITFTNVNINSQYTVGTKNATNSPLPVELTYFKAEQVQEVVQLTWTTASETHNSHFLVQKKEGRNWANIGRIKGHGTTTEPREYEFIDQNPAQGTNYYRLKQVDFDGTFEYSDISTIDFSQEGNIQVQVLQNPVEANLNLQLQTAVKSNYKYQLVNMQGHAIKKGKWHLNKGYNRLSLSMTNLPSGVYFLNIHGNEHHVTKKILK